MNRYMNIENLVFEFSILNFVIVIVFVKGLDFILLYFVYLCIEVGWEFWMVLFCNVKMNGECVCFIVIFCENIMIILENNNNGNIIVFYEYYVGGEIIDFLFLFNINLFIV